MLDKIFDDQIALSLRQLEDLWQRADTLPHPTGEPAAQTEDIGTRHRTLVTESLGELSRTIEELQVAVEELRDQNEELTQYRQGAEVESSRYREFFESAPYACFITTKDGSVREANPKAAELLGISQKHLVSKPLILFVAPEDRRKLSATLVRLKQGEPQCNWQLRLENCQGVVFTVSATAIPVKNNRGEVRSLRLWMQELPEGGHEDREVSLGEGNGAVATSDFRPETQHLSDEPWLRSRFEGATAGMALLDSDGHLLDRNDTLARMLGCSAEALPELFAQLLNLHHSRLEAALFRQLLSGKRPSYQLEKRLLDTNAPVQWGRLTLFRVSGTATDSARIACLLEDITQQRQSALAQRQALSEPQPEVLPQFPAIPVEQLGGMFDEALSGTADLFLICDRTGKCLYVNRATARTLGIAQQECRGKPWQQLPLPAEAMELLGQAWQRVLERGCCTNEEISLPSEQGWRDYDCAIAPLGERQGEFPTISITAKDITEQKRAIAAATEALAKEQELNALQTHFAHVVSHELRNPLNNIYSCAQLVENRAQQWTEEKRNAYLHRIQLSVKRINRILDDFLLMQKAETGELKLQLTLINLDEFCQELIAEIQEGAGADYQITFIGQNQLAGLWDEKLLRQILTNLLLNGIKYSPKGSEVKLSLISQSEEVIFCIQDSGIGIPEAEQEVIFKPFHRANNVGNIIGSGLGLSIVKQCVALQGGEIAVESTEGKGTTFTVTLPLHQRQAIGVGSGAEGIKR